MLVFLKGLLMAVLCICLLCDMPKAMSSAGKILFIPQDDRPISYSQTVGVIREAGYEMILPPQELLSNAENMGHPDELWQWLEENAPAARLAVVSSDALLYGGLIPSRKHEVPEAKLAERLKNFARLHRKNPRLHIYVFDSLMRTPRVGTIGHIEEPEYYGYYGADIFSYTALKDKGETAGLSLAEEKELRDLEDNIPQEYLADWLGRRAKNLSATKKLMDYVRDGVIEYLILGRDDNAPLCQTHKENREILAYAQENNLSKHRFQSLSGIDEFNILLLNRAINDMTSDVPFVYVRYNKGVGGDTLPHYSDEKISASVDAALAIAGGFKVNNPQRADFVLLVNTDEKGRTFEVHNPYPEPGAFKPLLKPNGGTKYFASLVEDYLAQGLPVGVADIAFANGADNALMKILHDRQLLPRLWAYSGWNTPTNSTGFALGTGMLAGKMTEEGRQRLLAVRYLDDWAYQANVRTIVGKEFLEKFNDPSYYLQLRDKQDFAEGRNTELMREFAARNLPHFSCLQHFTVKNPWKRMFECSINFEE